MPTSRSSVGMLTASVSVAPARAHRERPDMSFRNAEGKQRASRGGGKRAGDASAAG